MHTTLRRLIGVTAAAAACAVAPGVGSASSDPECNRDGQVRPTFVTVTEAVWKPVGASDWRAFPDDVRVCDYDTSNPPITSFMVQLRVPTGVALADRMPAGSRFRLSLRTTDSRDPVQRVSGYFGNPDVTFRGRDVVVEGDVASVKVPDAWNGSEPVCPQTSRPVVLLDLQTNWEFAPGTVAYRQQGLVMGHNAARSGGLAVSGAGIGFSITGCGDGDPSTKEGFADGFIPGDFLVDLGLPEGALESAPPDAIDGFMQLLKDKTVDRTAEFTRVTRGGVLGVAFAFRTSYSTHEVSVGLEEQNVKALKKCSLAGAPAIYAETGGTTVVTCAAPLRLLSKGRWTLSGKRKSRLRVATLAFTPRPDVTYRVRATRGKVVRAGACKTGGARATCSVRLVGRGKWKIEVTSITEGIWGDVVTRTYRT